MHSSRNARLLAALITAVPLACSGGGDSDGTSGSSSGASSSSSGASGSASSSSSSSSGPSSSSSGSASSSSGSASSSSGSSGSIQLKAGSYSVDQATVFHPGTDDPARSCAAANFTLQITPLGGGVYEFMQNGETACDDVTLHCDNEKVHATLDAQGKATTLTVVSGSCTLSAGQMGQRTYALNQQPAGFLEGIEVSGAAITSFSLLVKQY